MIPLGVKHYRKAVSTVPQTRLCCFQHAHEWQTGCSHLGVAQPVAVQGKDGWRGIIHSWARGSEEITVRLDSGQKLIVPASLLTARPDGSYYAPVSLDQLWGGGPPAGQVAETAEGAVETQQPLVIPVIHEEVEIGKRKVETGGGVRIHKSAREEEQTVDLPLVYEQVEVERVPIDRAVDGPVAVRHVGDTIIVPVMQEVLVVQKQLRLVEELHIRRKRTEMHAPQTVVLRKEEATVERLEGDSRES
jgi:uncharacterized protein (TIGR02271 family)